MKPKTKITLIIIVIIGLIVAYYWNGTVRTNPGTSITTADSGRDTMAFDTLHSEIPGN